MHIGGDGYLDNHLVALARDLRQVTASGFRILPLAAVVDAWLSGRTGELEGRIAAITCDNGADFDYLDLPHPTAGVQRSVFNILRDFAVEHPGRQPALNVTSFAIVSPDARVELDRLCMLGKGWWTDAWWPAAVKDGSMHIGNGSWDHRHEALPDSYSMGARRGTFLPVTTHRLADHEIRQSADYLRAHAPNPGAALFAYPYGETNAFLTREYFPEFGDELGIKAAFTDRAGFLEAGVGRWEIPRLVFGRDWTSAEELQGILDGAADRTRAWKPVRKEPPPAALVAPSRQGKAGEFHQFFYEKVEPIPGWLFLEAALLTAHLAGVQRELDVHGPTLEIGVYRGKYLAALYRLSRPGERVVGVDLFVGSSNLAADVETVRANIAAACGEAGRLKMLVADSLELTSERLARDGGEKTFRFISIDGGHTREIVFRDLETAFPMLQRGGIIALDDVFNHTTPGVVEGVAEFFMRHKPALAPFALCANKMFVTTPDFHARYLRETLAFIEGANWLPTHESTLHRRRENTAGGFTPTMYGYEIIPFL